MNKPAHSNGAEHLIDWPKVWAIVRKNWMVLKSDRMRMIPMMMFPLVMLLIFGYTAGALPKYIPAAVVDYDQSHLSGFVINHFQANQLFSIEHFVGTQDEGRRLLDSGTVKVLFIVPPHFESDFAAGKPVAISLMVDESDPSVAQITKASTQAFVLQIGSELSGQRIAEISKINAKIQSNLNQAKSLVQAGSESEMRQALAPLLYAFQNTQLQAGKWRETLLIAGQTASNSVGFLAEPNAEYSTSTNPNFSAVTTAIQTESIQQSVLGQAAFYNGLAASQGKMVQNAGTLYSGANSLAGQLAVQRQKNQFSVQLIDQSTLELKSLDAKTQSLSTAPLGVDILEPYGSGRRGIDFLLPSILALIIFQGASAGLGRAIAGERQDGSLTRVFLTPTSNVTIILGTQLFYLLLEIIRSSFIVFVAILVFGVTISGNILSIIAIIALFSIGATGVGMILSVLTHTQEQYMAVSMLISMPMMFLAGVFIPIQTMPVFFQGVARILPITYAADALRGVMIKGFSLSLVVPDLIFLAVFGIITFYLTVKLFKRELV